MSQKKYEIEYLTRHEAAIFLRCSLSYLDHKAAEGKIPYHKLGNGKTSKVLFKITDLRKFIDKNRINL